MFAQRSEGCELESYPGQNSVVSQIWKYIQWLSVKNDAMANDILEVEGGGEEWEGGVGGGGRSITT